MIFRDRKYTIVELGAAAALAIVSLLVFTSVGTRYLFNFVISDSFDFIRLMLGIAVFWGISAALINDEHLKVDLLSSRLGPELRKILETFSFLVTLLFFVFLAWQIGNAVIQIAKSGQLTAELRIAVWPFYLLAFVALPIGCIIYVRRSYERFQQLGKDSDLTE